MFRDVKVLMSKIEAQVGRRLCQASDFEKLARLFAMRGVSVSASALKSVWNHVGMKEKPSAATLDKLALFAGFQSWNDFKTTLHGEDRVDLHYDENADL